MDSYRRRSRHRYDATGAAWPRDSLHEMQDAAPDNNRAGFSQSWFD
jgi:hypothetical protein